MYGCTMNRNNSHSCTIILIIIILACQGLLDGSPRSRNAITLLLLWWLCRGFGCGNNMIQSYGYQNAVNNCCQNNCCQNNCCQRCCCNTNCCSRCCCSCKEKKCKCKRIRLCYNNRGNMNNRYNNNCGCCC